MTHFFKITDVVINIHTNQEMKIIGMKPSPYDIIECSWNDPITGAPTKDTFCPEQINILTELKTNQCSILEGISWAIAEAFKKSDTIHLSYVPQLGGCVGSLVNKRDNMQPHSGCSIVCLMINEGIKTHKSDIEKFLTPIFFNHPSGNGITLRQGNIPNKLKLGYDY